MNLKVVVKKWEDGFFVARCLSLKSCWSQGKTREEALQGIREAIDLYLEPTEGEVSAHSAKEVVELSV